MNRLYKLLRPIALAIMLALVLLPALPARAMPSDMFKNGSLLLDGSTVYTIYRGQKIGFTSSSAFTGLGYKWTNLYGAQTGFIPNLSVKVNSAKEHHPWGSWVLWGKTVYFVHEDGLIPITIYSIFQNNGGEDKYLLTMNWYDSQLPQLSFMTYDDSRLKDRTANENVMQVQQGKSFTIELDSNPSTGYNWIVNYDTSSLSLEGRKYQPFADLPGSGGMEQFEFQGLKQGQSYITFYYQRSWEATPVRQESYKIIIE